MRGGETVAKLKFAKENTPTAKVEKQKYKILIVDDDTSIQEITNMSLGSMKFSDFDLEILCALSAKDAKTLLLEHNDIAMALVDVVMETPEAGLDLVNYIRNDLQNDLIRLVIRTGQANEFPVMEVVQKYDINDFKEKTELTVERLYTTVRSSVKQYQQLFDLQRKCEDTYTQMTTNRITKLPNRNKLSEDCDTPTQKTLILIDIIGFGEINTSNGHDVGDFVLCELGGFLQHMYGDKFNVYHLNGDLFGLAYLSDDHIGDIFEIVERIKIDISKLHMITNNFNRTVDTRIGVAYEDQKNLMRKAELALKEAHDKEKNHIQFYSEDLKVIKRLKDTNKWAPIIKKGLKNGDFQAYYQAIYDVDSKEILKYELLARLVHDESVHAPAAFLEAAKHSGQLCDIFQFMFDTACKKVKETGKRFSVNIGTIELGHDELLAFIQNTIIKYNIDSKLLSLELLEYNSINKEIKKRVVEIHNLGIEIIIDDFGVQCSNFGQIEDLPISTLKIDGSFIENIETSQNSKIIVQTIKTFANAKNIKLVAEFVCNEGVYNTIKELGIDYVQGYYLSEPQPEPL